MTRSAGCSQDKDVIAAFNACTLALPGPIPEALLQRLVLPSDPLGPSLVLPIEETTPHQSSSCARAVVHLTSAATVLAQAARELSVSI
eukprot:4561319-Amphidinium_carterae.1